MVLLLLSRSLVLPKHLPYSLERPLQVTNFVGFTPTSLWNNLLSPGGRGQLLRMARVQQLLFGAVFTNLVLIRRSISLDLTTNQEPLNSSRRKIFKAPGEGFDKKGTRGYFNSADDTVISKYVMNDEAAIGLLRVCILLQQYGYPLCITYHEPTRNLHSA